MIKALHAKMRGHIPLQNKNKTIIKQKIIFRQKNKSKTVKKGEVVKKFKNKLTGTAKYAKLEETNTKNIL